MVASAFLPENCRADRPSWEKPEREQTLFWLEAKLSDGSGESYSLQLATWVFPNSTLGLLKPEHPIQTLQLENHSNFCYQ